MALAKRIRQTLKRLVVGPATFPQRTIGLREPQSEVRVWLCGLGAPRDVTYCNVLTGGEAFHHRNWSRVQPRRVRATAAKLRGGEASSMEIRSLGRRPISPNGYCLPRARLWMFPLSASDRRTCLTRGMPR